MTLKEQQEYLISCLPNIGPSLAKELLSHFGCIAGVLSAPEEQLKKVPGIGDKIARSIREIILAQYDSKH